MDMKSLAISEERLREYMAQSMKTTTTFLSVEPQDSLMPNLLVATRTFDGGSVGDIKLELVAICVPFNGDIEKRNCMFTIGRGFYDQKKIPVGVVFTCEAWLAKFLHDEKVCKPSECDHKEEVIVCAGQLISDYGRAVVSNLPITRLRGNMVAGEWGEIFEGEFPLLMHFWQGFFSVVAEREGITQRN